MEKNPDEIKKFWDDKAKTHGEDWTATLGEQYLRLLEVKTMTRLIRRYGPRNVLDVGCGNGYSTKIYARRFPRIQFVGIDYSEKMIFHARKSQIQNCSFSVGDVLLFDSFPNGQFDLIISQRCLQNLVDYETQSMAIRNMLRKKSPRGILILMECSKDGVEQLNRTRMKFAKQAIEGIEPWHNTFLVDQKMIQDFGARIAHFSSTYMFLSKIIDPRLSFLGYALPAVGKFGYDKLYQIG